MLTNAKTYSVTFANDTAIWAKKLTDKERAIAHRLLLTTFKIGYDVKTKDTLTLGTKDGKTYRILSRKTYYSREKALQDMKDYDWVRVPKLEYEIDSLHKSPSVAYETVKNTEYGDIFFKRLCQVVLPLGVTLAVALGMLVLLFFISFFIAPPPSAPK